MSNNLKIHRRQLMSDDHILFLLAPTYFLKRGRYNMVAEYKKTQLMT